MTVCAYLRQRKDGFGGKLYPVPIMNENLIQSNLGVAVVLKNWPNTARVFMKHGTACVGCYLVRFCTVEDAINAHSLDRTSFLIDLEKVSTNSTSAKGAQNEKDQ